MLDQNPSYNQLCDMLEKKDLKFHRGQFASQLLSSVPDLTTPARDKPPVATSAPQVSPPLTGPPPVPPMTRNASGPPAAMQTQNQLAQPQAFNGPCPCIPPGGVNQEHSVFPDRKPAKSIKRSSIVPSKPEPTPEPKEAMARKRDFTELIDLTQLSDNEDYVLSNKHARLESPESEADPF